MASSSKLSVAVLFGGRSAEHEISLLSARFVVESLDRNKYEPILIGIDKSGRWLLQDEALLLSAARDPRLVKLNQSMPGVLLAPHPASDGAGLQRIESASSTPLGVDVIFPVLHGPMGEDGTVQGLLELAGLPYVGAGVLGSAVGMDKDVMKRLLEQAGLPILPYVTLRQQRYERDAAGELERASRLGFPLFVKPANLGSSVGVSRVLTPAALGPAVQLTFEALDCEGMARVDLFLDQHGKLWVNEINTIPGFTRVSMYPKLMEASGVPARELISRLLDDALAR